MRAGTSPGLRLPAGSPQRLAKGLVKERMKKAPFRQSNPAPQWGAALAFWDWTLGVRSRLTVWCWPSGASLLELLALWLAARFAPGLAGAGPAAHKNRQTRRRLSRP